MLEVVEVAESVSCAEAELVGGVIVAEVVK